MKTKLLSKRIEPDKLRFAAETLKVIAHPKRLEIIDLLEKRRRMTVTEIYEELGLRQALASQHLNLLRDKGVLLSEKIGKNIYYRLKNTDITTIISCMERYCKL